MCQRVLSYGAVLMLGMALSVPAGAEQFLVEHFNYPNGMDLNGQVAGQGAWVADGDNYMILNDDGLGDEGTSSLQYPGLTDSQGGRLTQGLTTNGDCDYILSTPLVGEGHTLYYSLLYKPTDIATSYFLTFVTSGSVNGGLGRLTGRDTGGEQELGIRLRTSDDNGWSGKTIALGETALVVIKLTMVPGPDNDVMELWVNPTVGTYEQPSDVVQLGGTAGNDINPDTGIQGFQFRTNGSAGSKEVDAFRFGTTWADVAGSVSKEAASAPSPGDEAADLPRDVVLSWMPGEGAPAVNGHKLYLSENFNDVNDGIGGIIQDSNEYIPDQLLAYESTYYWRVDEATATAAWNEGDVWSFQIEPVSRPIPGDLITAMADSNGVGHSPENTINGSGLEGDVHSKDLRDMWLSDHTEPNQAWIQYTFDKTYKLDQVMVWNHNGQAENVLGWGIKNALIEYSTDGVEWMSLGEVELVSATTAPFTDVDLQGVTAKSVRITAQSNWGGVLDQYGLSEVRFLTIPVFARTPEPVSGQTDVSLDVTLTWRAGREAVSHDLYIGTDPNDLPFAQTVAETSLNTFDLDLQLNQTYYWRVDEVNTAEDPSVWQGDVSEFTTYEFKPVDDFEAYGNDPNSFSRVFQTWIDGAGYTNPVTVPGNDSGSYMGHDPSLGNIMERAIYHDGSQSAPIYYGNGNKTVSEVIRTFDTAQAWNRGGVQALVLYVHGGPDNALAQLYVKINNTRVDYDGDQEVLQRAGWQKWYIPLSGMSSNDLAQVKSMTIGVEGSGTGVFFVDDIVLTANSRTLVPPTDPSSDNLVSHYAFDGDASDSTGAHPGELKGLSQFETGKVGQAISLAGVFGDYVEIPGFDGILGSGEITITAWIKTSATETGTIISWGPATPDGGRFGFRVDDGRIRSEFSGGNLQGDATINDGGWHHVAVTVQAGATISYPDVTLYVDGQDDTLPTADDTIIDILDDSEKVVRIGGRASAEDRWFGGLIDELHIYDRALSAEEIAGAAGRVAPFDR